MTDKELFIIAGPNGAGKSSYYSKFLTHLPFINLDDIAKQINPLEPGKAAIQAGRIAINELNKRLESSQSFAALDYFIWQISFKFYIAGERKRLESFLNLYRG